MSDAEVEGLGRRRGLPRVPAWLWVGAGVMLLLLLRGNALLNDPDMFWQISRKALETEIFPQVSAHLPWLGRQMRLC